MTPFVALAGRLMTCDPARATGADPLGVVQRAGVYVEGGLIRAVGSREEVLRAAQGAAVLFDAPDAVVTPGLCDAHTHAAFVGSRHDEYAKRMAGASYEDIARAGGGIAASAAAIAAASVEQIASALRARLFRMSSLGVTTVEVKSGYGLDEAGEKKQLDAIIQVARERDVARVVSTYLALHALPRAMADRRTEYVAAAAERVRAFAVQDLMQFVDAYVDENAFTPLEAEAIALAAAEAGVGVRLHAGQFADVGGAQLAARVGAKSADHLEHVSRGDLEAMAASGTRAVLLPLASFTLGDPPPPVSLMRRAGVAMVVASDANPGTAPSESLPLALALAVRAYGMTPEEALLGATREAAFALGLGDRVGIIAPGYEADLVLWDLPHEHAIVQPWGVSKTRAVVFAGQKQTPRQ